MLRIREQTHDEDLRGMVRQVLVQLGHTDPLPSKGIRLLSIDGGGVRGILVIEMLKKLEELTGKRVYEMFDFICGVSTGAILTSLLGNCLIYRFLKILHVERIWRVIASCR